MIIKINDTYLSEDNYHWVLTIDEQHSNYFPARQQTIEQPELDQWYNWLENEWQCNLLLSENKKSIDGLIFNEQTYLLAVLKYGFPSLIDGQE